jgi:hypothetical protein
MEKVEKLGTKKFLISDSIIPDFLLRQIVELGILNL